MRRAPLPSPSSEHATCAWCRFQADSIVDLIDHVDAMHLGGSNASAVDRRDVA